MPTIWSNSTTSSRTTSSRSKTPDDNIRFFDHRREDARTDWDRGGLPSEEWEALLAKARRLADEAGHYRYPLPKEYGGKDGTNLGMAIIREHLAAKGLGLHNDLQNEHSIVGNNVGLLLMMHTAPRSRRRSGFRRCSRGHDAASPSASPSPITAPTRRTWRRSRVRDGDDWLINGEKTWNTGIHKAKYDLIFARTGGKAGDGDGITAFLVPTNSNGFKVEEMLWTFNMPTDHGRISLTNVRVPHDAIFGGEGTGLGSCSTSSTRTASARRPRASAPRSSASTSRSNTPRCASPSASRCRATRAIQFPLVELQTQCEMLRALIHKTAWLMDTYGAFSVSDKVSMCNYWANRLCCEAADRAMQVHGGLGYSRHKPFEHIYRHHRRYRITEGAEEIQMRRVAGYMFGFMKQRAPKGVHEE